MSIALCLGWKMQWLGGGLTGVVGKIPDLDLVRNIFSR